MVSIEERKDKIIKEYGLEPTICYFYYLLNAVEYAGEVDLRKSFESIQGQGNEVIIGDYGSTDDTVKIAKEYGFKVVEIEKTPGIAFHMSKLVNKIVKESKSNFLADLDVHIEYPKSMTKIIKEWILRNDIRKHILGLRGRWINECGKYQTEYGFSSVLVTYRPYLLEARGYDERTYMGNGCTHYFLYLMTKVFNLSYYDVSVPEMIHKYHMDKKVKAMRDVLNIHNIWSAHLPSVQCGEVLADKLRIDFDKGVKNVQNSYW